MKKLILIAAIGALCAQVNAQTEIEVKSVPQPVVSTFDQAYPSTTVVWKRQGTYYIAEYNKDNSDKYITYDPAGKIIEQGEAAQESDIPASANTYVKTKYHGDHMTKIYKVKDANGHTMWKGKVKEGYVMFDENGNPMKMKRDD